MTRTQYRIALPIPSFLPAIGGAEVGLHNIALALLDGDHRPVVITSYSHVRALKRGGWNLPYDVIAYPPRLLTWYSTRPLIGHFLLNHFHAWLQRKYRFDVWHATFGYPVGTAVINFCLQHNLPHIVRCVGEDIQVNEKLSYGMRLNSSIDKVIRNTLPKSKKLIATTHTVAEEYRAIEVEEKKIVLIPNGVNLKRFQSFGKTSDLKRSIGIGDDTFLFVAVGRYHKKKNFEQLIRAANILSTTSSRPFAIAICGTGVKVLSKIAIKAKGLVFLIEPETEVQTNAEIKVPSDEVLNWYYSSDCFLMPSLLESFGIVTIEAMACDLPVIGANSPGNRDVLRDGKDGLIYDGSVEQLVKKMSQVLDDEKLREDLIRLSQDRALDFDWSEIVDQYVEIYDEMAGEKASLGK